MLGITGASSAIAQDLLHFLPFDEEVRTWRPPAPLPSADRYLFAQGVLHGHAAGEHNAQSAAETFDANFVKVAASIDAIMRANPCARVVVITSESGFSGSHDTAYAAAKAGLHTYIETKRLQPEQQLVGVAPGMIADAGMTLRRADPERVAERRRAHPKRRLLVAAEVAALVHFLLYRDGGYITGTVIRMHGGEPTWR